VAQLSLKGLSDHALSGAKREAPAGQASHGLNSDFFAQHHDGQLPLVTEAANDLVNLLHDVWLDACRFVQRDQPRVADRELLLLVAAHRTCGLLEPLLQMGKHPAAADGHYIWQDAAYLAGWSTGYRVRLSETCNGICSRCVRG
jgi:hypothetical protein